MNEILDVAIIGAGLSGLSCARDLQESGLSVRLLDKGRGLGGRDATRRVSAEGADEPATFDHGAQFFTARSPEFVAQVEAWKGAGLAREWFQGQATLRQDGSVETKPDGHPRFCCPRGMSALAKDMARGLDVRTSTRITKLQHEGGLWILHAEDGEATRSKAIVMTAPVPQSLELLASSEVRLPEEALQVLGAMRYERCIAAMLVLSEAPRLPGEGALYADTSKLSWLGDNAAKGVSARPALTLHGAPAWSEQHWEASEAEVVSQLSDAASPFWSGEIVAQSVARWKFSKPIEPRDDGCHVLAQEALVFAGDAFGGGKVEGAWASGRKAAQAVRKLLGE